MEKITENVYLIGSSEISHKFDCMVYVIKGKTGCIMIDSGAGISDYVLNDNVKTLGYENGPEAIILTHCHIDHIGGAKYFKDKYGTKIYSSKIDAKAIQGENMHLVASDWYNVNYIPTQVDYKISDKETLDICGLELKIISTPGHTPGSICVMVEIDNEKILFAQDVHGPFIKEWGSDKKVWKKSMEKLLSLNATILCEGHYGIYYGNKANEFIKSQISMNS